MTFCVVLLAIQNVLGYNKLGGKQKLELFPICIFRTTFLSLEKNPNFVDFKLFFFSDVAYGSNRIITFY